MENEFFKNHKHLYKNYSSSIHPQRSQVAFVLPHTSARMPFAIHSAWFLRIDFLLRLVHPSETLDQLVTKTLAFPQGCVLSMLQPQASLTAWCRSYCLQFLLAFSFRNLLLFLPQGKNRKRDLCERMLSLFLLWWLCILREGLKGSRSCLSFHVNGALKPI